MKTCICVAATLLLIACAPPIAENDAAEAISPEQTVDAGAAAEIAEATNAIGERAETTRDFAGKWVGPEGLALEIGPGNTTATRRLRITLLDGTNDYIGTAGDDGIAFVRNGVTERIRAGTGEETGLKYLAGKRDCLIIKSGEGFCRD